jgi:site-specific recombinase XerD
MSKSILTQNHRRFSILPSEWKIVFEANQSISTKHQRAQVEQFIYFANFKNATPNLIERAIFENFSALKVELLGLENGHRNAQFVFRAWETLRKHVDFVLNPVPVDILVGRFLNPPLSIYRDRFREDISAYSTWLRYRGVLLHSDPAATTGNSKRLADLPLREVSIKNATTLIRASAGAQVRAGRDAREIGAIRDVVSVSAIVTMLNDRRSRRRVPSATNAHEVARYAYSDALTARRLAWIAMSWCKITAAGRDEIDEFLLSVPWKKRYDRFFRPTNVVRRLRQFDDPAVFERWISLPSQLIRRAEKTRHAEGKVRPRSINDVEVALSLALLRESPIRLRALATLRLGGRQPNIVAKRETLLITYPDDSKSRRDMRILLSDDVRRILDTYIRQYRPAALDLARSSRDNIYLFPGIADKNRHAVSLSANWKRRHAEVGLDVNIHLVRHIMAKIAASRYKAAPETIRLLLGHRNLDTTFRCYIEDALPRASQHLQNLLSSDPHARTSVVKRAISPDVELTSLQVPTSELLESRLHFRSMSAGYRREILRSFASFRTYLSGARQPVKPRKALLGGFVDSINAAYAPSTIVNVLRHLVRVVVALCTRDTASWFIREAKPLIQELRKHSSSNEQRPCAPMITLAAKGYMKAWPAPIRDAWKRAINGHRVVGQRHLEKDLEHRLARIYAGFLSFVRSKEIAPSLCRQSVTAFLDNSRARGLKPSSVWRYAHDLLRFAKIVQMPAELTWFDHLVGECRTLYRRDQGFRGLEIITRPEDLLSLGRELIERSEDRSLTHIESAVTYRDGLLTQFLVSVPLRLEMLYRAGIDDVRLHNHNASILVRQKTLVGIRQIEFPLWPDVQRLMTRYLNVYRPILLTDFSDHALWVSRRGDRLSRGGIDEALASRTIERFGISLPPDRIRQIVANWIIEQTPSDFAHAATMLQLHGVDSLRQYGERAGMILAHNIVTVPEVRTTVQLPVSQSSFWSRREVGRKS